MKIKYSEIFYSFQGEAELAGKPSVWLRFFGCNLECNGFGQTNPADESTWELPYKDIDLIDVKSVDELPVFSTGCDSSYSWSNRYKHLCPSESVQEVCDKIESHLPDGQFSSVENLRPGRTDNMLCFTGGEPMLRQRHMQAIVNEFIERGNIPKTITVETNGTKPISKEFKEWIYHIAYQYDIRWHWAISPKLLHTAGEVDAVLPEVILGYADISPRVTSILKFVCNGTDASWNEIGESLDNIYDAFGEETTVPNTWIMPVGATKEQQEDISGIAVEAMRRGYYVATRNHAYVFGNQIGT